MIGLREESGEGEEFCTPFENTNLNPQVWNICDKRNTNGYKSLTPPRREDAPLLERKLWGRLGELRVPHRYKPLNWGI